MKKKTQKPKIINDMRVNLTPDYLFDDDFFDNSLPENKLDGIIEEHISLAVAFLQYDKECLAEPILSGNMSMVSHFLATFRYNIYYYCFDIQKDMTAAKNCCTSIMKALHKAIYRESLCESLCRILVSALRCNYKRINAGTLYLEHIYSLLNCLDEVENGINDMNEIDRQFNTCTDPKLLKEYDGIRKKILATLYEINSRYGYICDVDLCIRNNKRRQASLMKDFKESRKLALEERKKNAELPQKRR